MTIRIETVDVHNVPEATLHGMHEAYADRNNDFYPDDPPLTFDYHKANWLAPNGIHRNEQFRAAFDGDEVVGASRAITWIDHEDSGLVVPAVQRRRRREGIGLQLIAASFDDLEADGRSKAIIDAPVDSPGEPALERLGMKKALGERVSRLALVEVDWDLIDTWIERATQRADEYELLFFDDIVPDEHLDNWCRVNDVMNDAPLEGLDIEDTKMTPEKWRSVEANYQPRGLQFRGAVAVHEPSGDFAGLTVLMNQKHEPWLGYQDDTGVDPSHRNKGLGRWLKAAMLKRFVAEFPDVTEIETGNAGSNEPMLNINVAMGFKPALMVNAWQGDIATARQALGV